MQIRNTGWLFGGLIFAALFTLSFRFEQGQVTFLAQASGHWLVKSVSFAAIFGACFAASRLSKNQLFCLSMLYATTSFAFYFTPTQGVNFILWQKDLFVVVCLWLVAALLFSRYLMPHKQQMY